MTEYVGKSVLVTGGGSGIGRALVHELARKGAAVAVTDIDEARAQAAAIEVLEHGGNAKAFGLDVTNAGQWKSIVANTESELGPIATLCSNAGSSSARKELVDLDAEYLRWLFDVNVLGSVHAIQAVLPHMLERKRGNVLFTGSLASLWTAPTGADYAATKHALLAVADTLRQETAGKGINVSIVCPAGVPTNLLETTKAQAEKRVGAHSEPAPELSAEVVAAATAASGGLVSAEDVARLALEGLENGTFFVFTHPGSLEFTKTRAHDLEAAYPAHLGAF